MHSWLRRGIVRRRVTRTEVAQTGGGGAIDTGSLRPGRAKRVLRGGRRGKWGKGNDMGWSAQAVPDPLPLSALSYICAKYVQYVQYVLSVGVSGGGKKSRRSFTERGQLHSPHASQLPHAPAAPSHARLHDGGSTPPLTAKEHTRAMTSADCAEFKCRGSSSTFQAVQQEHDFWRPSAGEGSDHVRDLSSQGQTRHPDETEPTHDTHAIHYNPRLDLTLKE